MRYIAESAELPIEMSIISEASTVVPYTEEEEVGLLRHPLQWLHPLLLPTSLLFVSLEQTNLTIGWTQYTVLLTFDLLGVGLSCSLGLFKQFFQIELHGRLST